MTKYSDVCANLFGSLVAGIIWFILCTHSTNQLQQRTAEVSSNHGVAYLDDGSLRLAFLVNGHLKSIDAKPYSDSSDTLNQALLTKDFPGINFTEATYLKNHRISTRYGLAEITLWASGVFLNISLILFGLALYKLWAVNRNSLPSLETQGC